MNVFGINVKLYLESQADLNVKDQAPKQRSAVISTAKKSSSSLLMLRKESQEKMNQELGRFKRQLKESECEPQSEAIDQIQSLTLDGKKRKGPRVTQSAKSNSGLSQFFSQAKSSFQAIKEETAHGDISPAEMLELGAMNDKSNLKLIEDISSQDTQQACEILLHGQKSTTEHSIRSDLRWATK